LSNSYEDLPLDKVLEYSSLQKITYHPYGDGWYGHRYSVKLFDHEESNPMETFEEIRQWILKEQGSWIQHLHRCNTDEKYAERQRLLNE
jgi:hypothetical protein